MQQSTNFEQQNNDIKAKNTYQELIELLIVPDHARRTMSESREFGDHILGLGKLGVDSGQLVDRRGDPEASHVGGEQLLVKRMRQNLGHVPCILPVHRSMFPALDHNSHSYGSLALVRVAAVEVEVVATAAVLQVLGRFVGHGSGNHGVTGGGNVVDYVTVVAVKDGAGEPLVRRLGDGGRIRGGVEVQEIGAVNVIVCGSGGGVVVLGLGAEEGVVEPIGCALQGLVVVVVVGAGFRGRVRGGGVSGELVDGAQGIVVRQASVLRFLLLGLVREMLERDVL